MFSSKSNEWETPQDFYDKLNNQFKFTLDPCCTASSTKCSKYYTSQDDGLSQSWKDETVFVNPPYGNIKAWVKKAYDESINHNAIVVMLIPARTDTKYWHDYIMTEADSIYFVKGRLKFGNGTDKQNSAPFPSAVIVFDRRRFKWVGGPRVNTLIR
jgi:site-specific DNA-methyltransferase (adenine-specific)